MTLRKRIQIILALLVGIPLLLLLYESYQTGRKTLVTHMKQEAFQTAQLETAKMDLTFEPSRLIVEGLVRTLETEPAPSPGRISELLRRTLHDNPEIYGVAVALDPAQTKLGRFAPYVYRPNGVETEIALTYEYTDRDWYRQPVKSGRPKWIKPYFGEGGKTVMVTYSAPIKFNGRVVGIAAVDLDLDSLLKRLHFLKPSGDGTVYLVNRLGHILAHPDLEAITALPENDTTGALAVLINKKGLDTVEMIDPVSRKKSWIVESPINSLSAAHGGEDWSLIVSWPLDKRMAPLTGMGRRMLVLYLFLGGAALWFLNRTFDDNITRPLRKLAEQARKYAEGDFTHPPSNLNDARELRELGKALNELGTTLKDKTSQTSNGDAP